MKLQFSHTCFNFHSAIITVTVACCVKHALDSIFISAKDSAKTEAIYFSFS